MHPLLLCGLDTYQTHYFSKLRKLKMLIKNSHCTGCKEGQFYSLSFGQVAAGMYQPKSHFDEQD